MEHLALLGIDNQNLARSHPSLGNDLFWLIAVGADLGGQRNEPVVGGDPPGRAESISIEQAAGISPVG